MSSLHDIINSSETMGKILDQAKVAEPTEEEWEKVEKWLEGSENQKQLRTLWEQAMCLAYIDGDRVAAAWLQEKVKDPKLKLPGAAQDLYDLYQQCKERRRTTR